MTRKEESIIQENLSKLYLRLNGYFTSGFVLHSNQDGKEIGEVDILAVRFPLHSQDETEHNSSPYLEVPNNIDIVVSEVKSKGQQLHFNDSLLIPESWEKILNWIGLFEKNSIKQISEEMVKLLKPNKKENNFKSCPIKVSFGIVTIRPIIFSVERNTSHNESKFISWEELNGFIWNCFCPVPKSRTDCGTRYGFDLWGSEFSEIVVAYKGRQKEQEKFESIKELYEQLSNQRKLKEKSEKS
ncbi:MAG: hypothetical protein HY064_09705 [Bacteroidetes bacterium]|nr:hypothetical protein [Bacteroidota bacterium]